MRCSNCGTENKDTAKFCRTCGAKLVDEQKKVETKQKCKFCGSELDPNMKFCKYCGQPVQSNPKNPNKNKLWWKVIGVILSVFLLIGIFIAVDYIIDGKLLIFSFGGKTKEVMENNEEESISSLESSEEENVIESEEKTEKENIIENEGEIESEKDDKTNETTGAETANTEEDTSGSTSEDTKVDVYNTIFQDNGYVKDITAGDLVELYDYSQLQTIAKADVEPSEEDVQATIDEQRKLFATTKQVTDRAVEDGDIICIDFTGKIDGVEFDGGKSEDYVLDPNDDNFIDGFYEQIIGHTPSEESFDIQVTFPDPYEPNEELSGKDATFTIVLKYIKENELPEFNDAFVQDTLGASVSAEEYRQQTKESLQSDNVLEYLYDKVISESTVDNIPSTITDALRAIVDDTSMQEAAAVGMELEEFYEQVDPDGEERETLCLEQAKIILVVQAIAEKEGIEATDDNVLDYFGSEDTRDGYVEYFGKGYSYSGALPILTMQKLAENVTIE
ncbi:Trigger factor [Clostridiales bacterium CHKCI001]|nr:Trigger factor [Clostridiales bacterium CHKCI001]